MERADKRERDHYFRVGQPHALGVPREDPRGRAPLHDFKLIANVDEYPARGRKPHVFVKMSLYSEPSQHLDPPSRNILRK